VVPVDLSRRCSFPSAGDYRVTLRYRTGAAGMAIPVLGEDTINVRITPGWVPPPPMPQPPPAPVPAGRPELRVDGASRVDARPGAPAILPLSVVNVGNETGMVDEPREEFVILQLKDASGRTVRCQSFGRPGRVEPTRLMPGERRSLQVDLAKVCRFPAEGVVRGDWRYQSRARKGVLAVTGGGPLEVVLGYRPTPPPPPPPPNPYPNPQPNPYPNPQPNPPPNPYPNPQPNPNPPPNPYPNPNPPPQQGQGHARIDIPGQLTVRPNETPVAKLTVVSDGSGTVRVQQPSSGYVRILRAQDQRGRNLRCSAPVATMVMNPVDLPAGSSLGFDLNLGQLCKLHGVDRYTFTLAYQSPAPAGGMSVVGQGTLVVTVDPHADRTDGNGHGNSGGGDDDDHGHGNGHGHGHGRH
jgi:hypothetical protein